MRPNGKKANFKVKVVHALGVLTTSFFAVFHATHAAQMTDLRGQRYCEVILAGQTILVYNTIGLNHCPEALWDKLTVQDIKKQTAVPYVKLNGPRYWMIDGIDNSTLIETKQIVFGGISMREAGILRLGFWERLMGDRPYKEHRVSRHTTWVFQAGKPVYELIDPKGHIFVMQSYSTQKEPQTESSLAQLGTRLTLPKDWHFKSGILKQDQHLSSIDDIAVVLQDNLQNTYQETAQDYL